MAFSKQRLLVNCAKVVEQTLQSWSPWSPSSSDAISGVSNNIIIINFCTDVSQWFMLNWIRSSDAQQTFKP